MAAFAKKGRILIIEGNERDRRLFKHLLRRHYEITAACSRAEFEKLLDSFDPEVVVLDSDSPSLDGLELTQLIREKNVLRNDYTGILIMLEYGDSPQVDPAVDLGVDGFCLKAFARHQLLPAVNTVYRLHHMTTQLKKYSEDLLKANAALEQLTITDELTGLFNMRHINFRLEDEFEAAKRHETPLSVLMIDIDHLKDINDRADHLLGSYVIAEVGREIQREVRRIDIPGRYGGDEFVVILPHTNAAGAKTLADRLHDRIQKRVYNNGMDCTHITISQGIACFESQKSRLKSGKELMRRADHALFQAKENGRNAVVVYSAGAVRRRPRKKSEAS